MTEVVPGVTALHPGLGRLFLTIGVFDGLHVGHAYLLERLVAEAGRLEARPTVITFDAHPDEILVGAAPPLLLDPEERLSRLAATGVEVTVVQHFDETVRRTAFDAFVSAIADRVDLAGFLMTPESAFGHERRGTPAAVAALGDRLGYETVVVPSLTLDERPVSSSEIRRRIGAADLAGAAALLGRPYAVVGDLDEAGRLTFRMPVALPPPGRYRADGRELVVDGQGARVDPASAPGRRRLEIEPHP
jgi:riboflavin kinase/FMN adenylyltransferase